MRIELLPLDPGTYEPDALHSPDRVWTETNCYVDVWIEVLHALGHDPAAAGAFAVASDFEGDQWTFFKYPTEDLRVLFGIEVAEMAVWRPLPLHVAEQLRLGRLMTIEVDSWFLPDTRGVSYRSEHVKTTIVPQMIDLDAGRLGYFHNAGYHELEGDDLVGTLGDHEQPDERLPPYAELVRLERMRPSGSEGAGDASPGAERLVVAARDALTRHLARRPDTNPVTRFAERLGDDLLWLTGAGLEAFHRYAFATCRQCGAAAEIAASFVQWIGHSDGGLEGAEAWLRDLAAQAKALQFALARAASGRKVEVGGVLHEMERSWEASMTALDERYAG